MPLLIGSVDVMKGVDVMNGVEVVWVDSSVVTVDIDVVRWPNIVSDQLLEMK